MTRETVVLVSIDTEEDNWYCSRNGVAVSNIRALEPLARFFDRLGVRPTYLVTYQVAIDPCAAETVRNVAADYRTAFGRRAPRVGAIAVMIDSNDTGSAAEATIGELVFARTLPKE